MNLFAKHRRRIIELSALTLFICMFSRRITLIHSSTLAPLSSENNNNFSPYLYNSDDSSPVLEQGRLSEIDFTKSKAPKVVEFYNPKCGACQAFKYNYIEVAKKVQETRPDVEFYGVSCEAYPTLCKSTRVPQIMVFPSPESEGVEVPKGAGTIYFLSQRLLKALRSPEEIAAYSSSGLTLLRRRLYDGESDDENDAYESEDVYLNDAEEGEEGVDKVNYENEETVIPKPPEAKDDGNKELADGSKDSENDKTTIDTKWDGNKLVEVKGVPRDQWKSIHETDAWKNTMNELQNSDSKLGAEFLKWKHEHDAKLRAQAAQAEIEKNRLNSKIDGDVKRESDTLHQDQSRTNHVATQREISPPKVPQSDISPPEVFPANLSPEQEKKFKDYIAKKRQAAIRREQLKHPVKTMLGVGDAKTTEIKTKDHSPMKNYKAQYESISGAKVKADLRQGTHHKSASENMLSKVPIVRRVFNKQSHAQDTLNDAALSFTRGLLMGVYKGTNKGPLDYKRKKALKDWLDLLSVSLPPEMGLHDLIGTLSTEIDNIAASEVNLKRIIEYHYTQTPGANWSKSCTAEAGSLGFFCGFWKLLHIMSLGVAEHAGGLVLRESNPSIRVFSTQEAASVLREYMIYFFNCDKCTKNFVGSYDSCSFSRCTRLSDATNYLSVSSWRQFPLWLWEVHNDVSRSKANRAVEIFSSRGRKAEAQKFERDMRAVYPHIDQCITCYDRDGKWNVDAVYTHLEQEYWDFGHGVSRTVEEMLDYTGSGNKGPLSGVVRFFLLSILICAVTYTAKRQKLQLTGRHKKQEFEFGRISFVSNRDPPTSSNTKYRDS